MNLTEEQIANINRVWNLDPMDADEGQLIKGQSRAVILGKILEYEGIFGHSGTSRIMRTIEILYELDFSKREQFELDTKPSPKPSDERYR